MSETQPNVNLLESPYDPRLSAEDNGVNPLALEFHVGLSPSARRSLGAVGVRALEQLPAVAAETDSTD